MWLRWHGLIVVVQWADSGITGLKVPLICKGFKEIGEHTITSEDAPWTGITSVTLIFVGWNGCAS